MLLELKLKIAILGTVGLPASYGGFETLVDNLVKHHHSRALPHEVTVYCSSRAYPTRPLPSTYLSAKLRYIPLWANGIQSIPYDIWSLFSAIWRKSDVILLLGVSGALALPVVRFFSSARVITNIDGIEWRREKWQGWAGRFLRWSEKIAVRFSHDVIADNGAIADYVKEVYGADCHVIAYGGDHAVSANAHSVEEYDLPGTYAFSVCRIEPENNVHLVLDALSRQASLSLVMVGNWNQSQYGRDLRAHYAGFDNLYLLDPIYDLGKLKTLRTHAACYVHGHSAGGTNPSLVEAMHFGKTVLAFDCAFNRVTTENKALYFRDAEELVSSISSLEPSLQTELSSAMLEIAQRRYTWDVVASEYVELICGERSPESTT